MFPRLWFFGEAGFATDRNVAATTFDIGFYASLVILAAYSYILMLAGT